MRGGKKKKVQNVCHAPRGRSSLHHADRRKREEKKIRQADEVKFSQRFESQHQEKTLLLRGAALASLFTIHKIQVLLSNSVQAFHISVVERQTTASLSCLSLSLSLLLSVFGFPILNLGFM